MSKKIFVCDYDGCYRYGDFTRPEDSDIDAVRRFRKNGGVFGIVTERDVFEIMAISGLFCGEYDFIVASSGACGAVNMSLISNDVKGSFPKWIFRDGLNSALAYDIVRLLKSAGAACAVIDTLGFMGGDEMAHDFKKAYDREGGFSCRTHFWFDGSYFQESVSHEAMRYMFPISRLTARFESSLRADGAIAAIAQKYPGQVAIHRSRSCFDMTVPTANKVCGIERMLEYLGITGGVWALGDSHRDAGMLKRYHGFAMTVSDPEAAAAAGCGIVSNVEEAINRIMAKLDQTQMT